MLSPKARKTRKLFLNHFLGTLAQILRFLNVLRATIGRQERISGIVARRTLHIAPL